MAATSGGASGAPRKMRIGGASDDVSVTSVIDRLLTSGPAATIRQHWPAVETLADDEEGAASMADRVRHAPLLVRRYV